jgi:hypothetical protein
LSRRRVGRLRCFATVEKTSLEEDCPHSLQRSARADSAGQTV